MIYFCAAGDAVPVIRDAGAAIATDEGITADKLYAVIFVPRM